MVRKRLSLPSLLGSALLAVVLAAPALACPPSIAVERPAHAAASEDSGAFVLVRAFQGCHAGTIAVSGTAVGLVDGERRSIPLRLLPTATADVYAVRRQWPSEGVWVLRLTVTVGDGHATALVGIGASGEVATVRQPARDGRAIRDLTDADVTAMLRSLAAG